MRANSLGNYRNIPNHGGVLVKGKGMHNTVHVIVQHALDRAQCTVHVHMYMCMCGQFSTCTVSSTQCVGSSAHVQYPPQTSHCSSKHNGCGQGQLCRPHTQQTYTYFTNTYLHKYTQSGMEKMYSMYTYCTCVCLAGVQSLQLHV